MNIDLQTAILIDGLDDWVHLRQIDQAAQRLHPELDQNGRLDVTLNAVEQLLDRGLTQAGTVTEQEGYRALGEPTSAVVAKIRAAVRDDNDPEVWGYAVWLRNTPAGTARALDAEAAGVVWP